MILELRDATVDLAATEVRLGGERHKLTTIEARVVQFLAENTHRVVPRAELLEKVWGWRASRTTRAVDSTISRLRRKLELDPGEPSSLLTLHGFGYRLVLARPPVSVAAEPTLVGRDRELERLHELSRAARVVVLHGPGGVGKTTLARAFAASLGSARLADLSGAADADAVVSAVALALGLRTEGTIAQVAARIGRATPDVVVADGADGDVDAVVATLLALPGGTSFVVTSRRVPAHEARLAVEPLGRDDAVALYVRRARLTVQDYARSGTPPGLEALCDALDGLPLAIELAAARVRTVGPADLLRDLQRRAYVLSVAGDGLRTMDDVVAASWEPLDDVARRTLVEACVLGDPFELEVLEEVAERREEALPGLDRLVSASLVRGDGGRCSVLDTVRAWVLAHADPEVRAAATARRDALLARRIRDARDTEREAETAGHLRPHLERCLADPHAPAASRAVAVVGLTAIPMPGVIRARLLAQGIEAAVAAGRPEIEALLRIRRSTQLRLAGDRAGATEDLERAERVALELGDRRLAAAAEHAWGRLLVRAADPEAEARLLRVAALWREAGDAHGLGSALIDLGAVLRRSGRLDEARLVLVEAATTLRGRSENLLAVALLNLAAVRSTQGRSEDARTLYEEARALLEPRGDVKNLAVAYAGLANVALVAGELAAALERFDRAVALHRSDGGREGEGYALAGRAQVHQLAGRSTAAELDLREAVAAAEDTGDVLLGWFARFRLADLRVEEGRLAEGLADLERAVATAPPMYRIAASTGLATARALDGRPDEAEAALVGLPEPRDAVERAVLALARAHVDLARGAALPLSLAELHELEEEPRVRSRVRLLRASARRGRGPSGA